MGAFRKKLQARNRVLIAGMVTGVLLSVIMVLWQGSRLKAMPDFIQGFEMGTVMGMLLSLSGLIFLNLHTMRSPERMRKLLIEETDERNQMIQQKIGAVGYSLAMYSLTIATIVAGFIDTTVYFTLLASLLFIVLLKAALKLYYRTRY